MRYWKGGQVVLAAWNNGYWNPIAPVHPTVYMGTWLGREGYIWWRTSSHAPKYVAGAVCSPGSWICIWANKSNSQGRYSVNLLSVLMTLTWGLPIHQEELCSCLYFQEKVILSKTDQSPSSARDAILSYSPSPCPITSLPALAPLTLPYSCYASVTSR